MLKYYILFVVLNILDLIGAYFLIDIDSELNPFCKYIWENIGFGAVILLKTLLTIFPIVVINIYYDIQSVIAKYVIIFANILVMLPIITYCYLLFYYIKI